MYVGVPRRRYPAEPGAYEMQKEIGSGQTAAVWAARVRKTGESVAVKVFNIPYLQGDKVRSGTLIVTLSQQSETLVFLACALGHLLETLSA